MAESAILFNTQDVTFSYPSPAKLKKWIISVVQTEGGNIQVLNFIICSDNYLLSMNRKYLEHDTFTDVITFPYSQVISKLEGDIYISLERIKENSADRDIPLEEELKRVMIHGVLHLLGYGDKSEEAKRKMTEVEDRYLQTF